MATFNVRDHITMLEISLFGTEPIKVNVTDTRENIISATPDVQILLNQKNRPLTINFQRVKTNAFNSQDTDIPKIE